MPKRLVRAIQISLISIVLWIGFNLFISHGSLIPEPLKGASSILNLAQVSGLPISKEGIVTLDSQGLLSSLVDLTVLQGKDGKYRAFLLGTDKMGKMEFLTMTSSDGKRFDNPQKTKFTYPSEFPQVARFGDGYKAYYLQNHAIYTSYSPDGVKFGSGSPTGLVLRGETKHELGATVVQADSGRYRMFFVENGEKDDKSGVWGAMSTDGIKFKKDKEPTLNFADITGHPSVVKMDDRYFMFYSSRSRLFWAESQDGLKFEDKGGLDLEGVSPSGVVLENGDVRLYYLSFGQNTTGQVLSAIIPRKLLE